jgi:hypothetical protein
MLPRIYVSHGPRNPDPNKDPETKPVLIHADSDPNQTLSDKNLIFYMKNVLEVCNIGGQKTYLQIPLGSGSTFPIQIRIQDTCVVDPDPIILITCIPIRIRIRIK